jgi:hypothetical protein
MAIELNGLFVLNNSSGTHLPHHSFEDALYLGIGHMTEKRHALPRGDCLDEESID